MKINNFSFSIAYADTDAGGIVYHARYVEIAERARMKWLAGIIPTNGDIGFVIKELNMKYIRPLKLGDDIVVESHLIKVGTASLELEQKILKDGDVFAVMQGTAVYVGSDMKPKRIPNQILDVLNKI